MVADTIFSAGSLLVMPFWFLMLFLPSWLCRAVRGLDRSRLRGWPAAAWRADRPLTLLALGMLGLLAACAAGVVLDGRVIGGAPAWLKPAKFAVSIAVYALTLVWLLRFVEGRERLKRVISGVTVAAFVVEMAAIAAQAARGTTSHFNVATPLDAALWTAMGAAIQPVWVLCALVAFLLVRQRRGLDPALGAAVRGGTAIAVVGMLLAFFMTGPTAAQRAGLGTGPVTVVGAHSVGVADGGPGLPVLGWSTEGGDLRVGHFLGLHGLQALPLLAWGLGRLARRRSWLTEAHRAALVRTGGAAYLGLTLLAAWQALRGQSVVAPDALTVGALIVLGGVALATAAGIILAAAAARGAPRAARGPIPAPPCHNQASGDITWLGRSDGNGDSG